MMVLFKLEKLLPMEWKKKVSWKFLKFLWKMMKIKKVKKLKKNKKFHKNKKFNKIPKKLTIPTIN